MNAKQRNQNRDTAQNLSLAIREWDSKNRRFVTPVEKEALRIARKLVGRARRSQ